MCFGVSLSPRLFSCVCAVPLNKSDAFEECSGVLLAELLRFLKDWTQKNLHKTVTRVLGLTAGGPSCTETAPESVTLPSS